MLERTVDQATPAVSFAIVTVGITYIATTIAFLLTQTGRSELPFSVLVIIPMVPVGLFSALIAQNRTTQIRGYYLNSLERELRQLDEADLKPKKINHSRMPLPAFRLWSASAVVAERLTIKTALANIVHPYFQTVCFVEIYTIYVLDIYGTWNWWHGLVTLAYTAFLVGNAVQLVHARKYLLKGPPAVRRYDRHVLS